MSLKQQWQKEINIIVDLKLLFSLQIYRDYKSDSSFFMQLFEII